MTPPIALFLQQGKVLLEDEQIVPIECYFDMHGAFCGPDEAVVVMAGPCEAGLWYDIPVADFPKPTHH